MKGIKKLLRVIGIALLLSIVITPFLWMLISSFTPAESLFVKNPSLIPKNLWFGWYKNVFSSSNVPQYFLNSIIVSSTVMVITVVVSSLGAYSLTRFKYKGRNFLSHLILCTYIFPPILLMLPLNTILNGLNLIDTYLGIILAHLIPIGIREFIAHYDIRWGEIMATSVLISIPVIVIFISIQKYFIAGLTSGALKE